WPQAYLFCCASGAHKHLVHSCSLINSARTCATLATRFTTLRVPLFSSLPPLISLLGQSPNQEVNCASVGHFWQMSSPNSDTINCAVLSLTPSMFVRSTPSTR